MPRADARPCDVDLLALAETILAVCRDLCRPPPSVAGGRVDTHLENFGTWIDGEGRIVWRHQRLGDGIVGTEHALDQHRHGRALRQPAQRAPRRGVPRHMPLKAVCTTLFDGYREGLDKPLAIVLDRNHVWLRTRFVARRRRSARHSGSQDREAARRRSAARRKPEQPAAPALALFDQGAAGAGHRRSLIGRQHELAPAACGAALRWLGYGLWRMQPVGVAGDDTRRWCRPAAVRAHGGPAPAAQRDRGRAMPTVAPDPWYVGEGDLLVRRLVAEQPQDRRRAAAATYARLLQPELLRGHGPADLAVGASRHAQTAAYALRAAMTTRKQR